MENYRSPSCLMVKTLDCIKIFFDQKRMKFEPEFFPLLISKLFRFYGDEALFDFSNFELGCIKINFNPLTIGSNLEPLKQIVGSIISVVESESVIRPLR